MTTDLNPEGLERAAEAIDPGGWRLRRSSALPAGHEGRDAVVRRSLEQARAAITAYLGHTDVTTVAELDALPNGSVILDHLGDAWQKIADHWESVGEDIMSGDAFFRFHNLKALPATVLHRPTP